MADEISKKVLIEIDLSLDDARAAIKSYAADVNATATATDNLKKVTENSEAAIAQYNEKLTQSKLNAQLNREEISKLNLERKKEVDATRKAKESIQAANGSYAEASAKLAALGKAIKNAENGFASTTPIIKAQIAEYNNLNNQLKKFDEQMGNHQRKVGQYENALKGFAGSIIPGFNQFSTVLQSVSQGFNAMKGNASKASESIAEVGTAAQAGEAGLEGMSATMIGMVAAIALVVAGIGVLISWFAKLTPQADALKRQISGIGGAYEAFMSDLGKGVGFSELFNDMKQAHDEAVKLTGSMQDLRRAQRQDVVDDAKADAQIAEIQLKMRNRRNTPEQEKAYFDQIQKIAEDKYKGNKELADKEYELAVKRAVNGRKFSEEEKQRLMQDGIDYAIILDKAKGLVNGEDDLKAITEAQQKQIATSREREMVEERAQNRLDAINVKGEANAEKERQQIDELKRATDQANSERIASLARTLAFEKQSFDKELSDSEEHYRQLIFKQQEFVEKQQSLLHSAKATPRVKSAARTAIGAAQGDIDQLQKERYAASEKLVEDHNKKVLEETQKAADDLASLQIQSIDGAQERERQSENLAYSERREALAKELADLRENQSKLKASLKTATGDKAKLLQSELDHENELIAIANDKQTELQIQHQQKVLDDLKKFEDERIALLDRVAVLKATGARDPKALLAAEQQQALDQYNTEVSIKGLTDERKLELEQEYLNKRDELNRNYQLRNKQQELQLAQQIESSAFTILQQSLQQQNQAEQVNMERQKTFELQNQALTETQKYVVNEKYRVLEGKQKQKQFKQEQELNIGKAVMDGALAIMKAYAEEGPIIATAELPFLLAATALQITTIGAQKPPAYALGGIHYDSDGRGGRLPGYSKTDNTNANLRSGEGILVSEAMQNPYARSLASSINQAFGGRAFDSSVPVRPWITPGFAAGGVFSNYLPTGDNGLRPSLSGGPVSLHGNSVSDIVNGFAGAISKMPAPVVDVKDVNRQQSLLSYVQDRSSR
ncbi:MAG TPA: hypothetical protein VGN20_20540 [Mucilaginibacter sp.]|jgi:hypothetical protein